MKKLCLLCMRGNSKGVKNKNLKKINHKKYAKYVVLRQKVTKINNKINFRIVVVSSLIVNDCNLQIFCTFVLNLILGSSFEIFCI